MESLDLKKILIKGLKVNYACSCNRRVLSILENRNKEDLEDLLQDLELMNLEGKTAKEMYSYIDSWCYNNKKIDNSIIELVVDENNQNDELDRIAYINYINNNNYVEEQIFDINKLELTDRQKEILNIYATTNSIRKTAEILQVSASTVQVTIERIRTKLKVLSA